eukprot:c7797_g1_i1.p1 GENE.c7797_g1_i1~~c7797_g1_i1.p1  ORF type:complete len:356 (-),score=26.34 c7797_g1_i1:62-985(-)
MTDEQKQQLVTELAPVLAKSHPKTKLTNMEFIMFTGNSKILFAQLKSDGTQVAVKKIANRADPNIQWYVENEACMSLLCSFCPGVPRTLSCCKTKKNVWIIMEWIHGSSLKKLRMFMPLSPKLIAYVLQKVLITLAWMHERRMAHRDVKSTNVMVSAEGEIKVIDFGYTTLFTEENPIATDSVGTLLFMAPEVINETGHNTACDIWSLGVLAYELLCGEPPYHEFDVDTIAAKVRKGETPIFESPYRNTEASRFITRCMRRYPGTRPTASQLLEDPFIAEACTDEEWVAALKAALPDWPAVPRSSSV